MNYAVAFSLIKEGDNKRCKMNELLRLVFKEFKGYEFCSKSYTESCVAVAVGRLPIACDVEYINYSINKERLFKELCFFTTADIASEIMLSKNPHELAMRLWTRKECIYKYYNKRNIFPHNALAQTGSPIRVGESILYTGMIRNDLVLSYVCCTNEGVNLFENRDGELYEKI